MVSFVLPSNPPCFQKMVVGSMESAATHSLICIFRLEQSIITSQITVYDSASSSKILFYKVIEMDLLW
jgi:hypothetical protein